MTDITHEAVAKMLDGAAELRKFLDGSMTLDRLWFGEVSPKGMIFWWRQHLGRIDALMEAVQSLSAKLAGVTADRNSMNEVWQNAVISNGKAISRAEAAEAALAELTAAARAVIEADERGQGVGYSEAMDRLIAALKGDKP